jgi:hypothetical protein
MKNCLINEHIPWCEGFTDPETIPRTPLNDYCRYSEAAIPNFDYKGENYVHLASFKSFNGSLLPDSLILFLTYLG